MTRLDGHQHFWRYSARDHEWIGAGMEALRRDFLPDDLRPLLDAHGIRSSIAVQARQDREETRWLLELARANDWISGVVGWVDLRSATVERELAELAGETKLVGLRHVVQDEPDDDFLLREDFRRGIGCLRRFGLTYDVLIHERHLSVAERFVALFPEQPFVLDHLAKPRIREQRLDPWARDLRRLAAHRHVHCKISGLVTEAAWHGWRPADFTPYLDTALAAFGSERLMFGSDWPVCLLAASYAEVVAIVEDWAAPLSEGERAALFGGNAARFYT